jgi:uncharacterized membrane protein
VAAGQKLSLAISGTPKEATTGTATTTPEVASNRNLLIGAGALGVALILAGAWMYLRDHNRPKEKIHEEAEPSEFDSAEDVMDAIITLDDLHRAGKLSDEAHQKRRSELKEILKEKM